MRWEPTTRRTSRKCEGLRLGATLHHHDCGLAHSVAVCPICDHARGHGLGGPLPQLPHATGARVIGREREQRLVQLRYRLLVVVLVDHEAHVLDAGVDQSRAVLFTTARLASATEIFSNSSDFINSSMYATAPVSPSKA